MSEIPKAYEPRAVEEKWYRYWLDLGCFTADPARVSPTRPAYSIVIPPPNVTGVLTLGHVLNNTLQDVLARKARMDGKEVLWLPGTDHAGIATQTVVEKTLKKAGEIRHRNDLGRDQFLERVWQWKDKHGGIIIQQLKKLGCSCDWTRERFTMDPDYSRCVQRVFVDLYRKGLIYRGRRLVNWCPVSLTALSDEEVIMKEQKGLLYYFRVQVVEADGSPARWDGMPATNSAPAPDAAPAPPVYGPERDAQGRLWLTIATTRPETIPADTAVAVNPRDPRYAGLIGKYVLRALPLENQARLPIVGDDFIDIEFGTGVLKVTPAHDAADFEIGLRHRLPIIEVLTPDGKMTAEAGRDLVGLDRFAARKKAAEILEAAGTLVKTEPYVNKVGFSERADVPIEPRLSEQWFLKYPSVDKARACVVEGRLKFHPDRWAKVYDHWMANLKDWCISRQLWWGHRIPVWHKRVRLTPDNWANQLLPWGWDRYLEQARHNAARSLVIRIFRCADGREVDPKQDALMPVVPETEGEYDIYVCTADEIEGRSFEAHGFTQDPDVLDTWFSSWLWPFATMGWTGDPDTDAKNPTLRAFYPTTDLVTGPDIIFFWVARMIMAGYEFMGEPPFRNVYFTGIIRDKLGRKMSKSLGNSPDPLDLIARYGADALRFGTLRSAPLGQDILFDEQNVELGRHFCNKLWNACRFRQMQGEAAAGETNYSAVTASPLVPDLSNDLPADAADLRGLNPALLTADDKWILLRMDRAIREVTQAFTEYKFSDAAATLYRFFWSEYCDWYVEATKAVLNPAVPGMPDAEQQARRANTLAVMDCVLGRTLRLFHPFLPFITEELWQGLGYHRRFPKQRGGRTLLYAPWPAPFTVEDKQRFGLHPDAEQQAAIKYELVTLGRNLKARYQIPANRKVKFFLRPQQPLPPSELEALRLLLQAETIELPSSEWTPPRGTPMAANALGELYLPLAGLVDFAAERARLLRELDKARAELAKVQEKLANPNFTQKVPPPVLEEHQRRRADWQTRVTQLEQALANLPEQEG